MNLPNKLPEIHVMIDLETLGLKPGCKILSLGAFVFIGQEALSDPSNAEFYDRFDKQTQGILKEDIGTISWWAKQSIEARNEAFSGTKDIKIGLMQFASYIKCLAMEGTVTVWSNGAKFDLSLLEWVYNNVLEVEVPWHYQREECYRTLKNRFKSIVPAPAFEGVKHNALHDAINQGKHCAMILNWIKNANQLVSDSAIQNEENEAMFNDTGT